jgi:hypothetical protein
LFCLTLIPRTLNAVPRCGKKRAKTRAALLVSSSTEDYNGLAESGDSVVEEVPLVVSPVGNLLPLKTNQSSVPQWYR